MPLGVPPSVSPGEPTFGDPEDGPKPQPPEQPADDGEKSKGDKAQQMMWRALAVETLSNRTKAARRTPREGGDEGVDL
jgi:hypothetical protein